MTLLCLDAGNTRLKWGLLDDQGWLGRGTCLYDEIARLGKLLPRPERMLACNVAGTHVAQVIDQLARSIDVPLEWFCSAPAACGVTNGYADYAQLGADRWAALIGARSLHAGPALVVMAGTATTIDVLTADGSFAGGLILPGLDLMRSSLARNTAGLPEARGCFSTLPTNTDDAIVSGALLATAGSIDRMARHAAGDHFSILLSGGASRPLLPLLTLPTRFVDMLVLEGLARYFRQRAAGSG